MTRRLLLGAVALFTVSSLANAQKPPSRPRLPSGADTNDARSYSDFANDKIATDPKAAADAFYWAMRLEPSMADAYYGRRAALLLTDTRRLAQYDEGSNRVVQSGDIQRLDSLLSRAYMLNPMLPMRYERLLAFGSIKGWIEIQYGPLSLVEISQLQQNFDDWLREPGLAGGFKARMAQADGDYERALGYWATAIKGAKRKAYYRTSRARLFLQLGRADSSIAELTQALDELHKRDKKDFIVFYNSKAMVETTLGIAHQQLNEPQAAKDAFGRALQEDLAYFPAHVRLGYFALDQHDTTTALSEFELAVQLRPDDGLLRDQYGFALMSVGKVDSAVVQLQKAAELEPYYALPRRHLAEALEKGGKQQDANTAYRSFLALASRNDAMRQTVESHLATRP